MERRRRPTVAERHARAAAARRSSRRNAAVMSGVPAVDPLCLARLAARPDPQRQLDVSDENPVAVADKRDALNRRTVQECSVGAAEILQPYLVAAPQDVNPRVT